MRIEAAFSAIVSSLRSLARPEPAADAGFLAVWEEEETAVMAGESAGPSTSPAGGGALRADMAPPALPDHAPPTVPDPAPAMMSTRAVSVATDPATAWPGHLPWQAAGTPALPVTDTTFLDTAATAGPPQPALGHPPLLERNPVGPMATPAADLRKTATRTGNMPEIRLPASSAPSPLTGVAIPAPTATGPAVATAPSPALPATPDIPAPSMTAPARPIGRPDAPVQQGAGQTITAARQIPVAAAQNDARPLDPAGATADHPTALSNPLVSLATSAPPARVAKAPAAAPQPQAARPPPAIPQAEAGPVPPARPGPPTPEPAIATAEQPTATTPQQAERWPPSRTTATTLPPQAGAAAAHPAMDRPVAPSDTPAAPLHAEDRHRAQLVYRATMAPAPHMSAPDAPPTVTEPLPTAGTSPPQMQLQAIQPAGPDIAAPAVIAPDHAQPQPLHRADNSTPAAPAPPPGQIAQAVLSATDQQIDLRLAPEELGRVQLTLHQDGDILRVHIVADRPETLDLLRRHAGELAQDLRAAGHEGATFSFGGSPRDQHAQRHTAPMADADPPPPPRPAPPQGHDGTLDLRL